MSSEKKKSPFVTSTPKPTTTTAFKPILREKQWNLWNLSFADSDKKKIGYKSRVVSKENSHRSKQRPTKFNANPDYLEKRRLQAVEAMKIAEQRRLRLIQQESPSSSMNDSTLAESMANLSIVDYLPDGRLKLTRKQLLLRQEKHRRIRRFMEEQEARKKKEEAAKKKRKSVSFKITKHAWTPRPCFRTSSRVHLYSKKDPKDEKTDEGDDENKVETANAETMTENAKPFVIRYTIDELREMNPLGYYFMWLNRSKHFIQHYINRILFLINIY